MDVRRMDLSKIFVPTMILRKVPLEHLHAWRKPRSLTRKNGLICFEFANRISTLKIRKGFEI